MTQFGIHLAHNSVLISRAQQGQYLHVCHKYLQYDDKEKGGGGGGGGRESERRTVKYYSQINRRNMV